MSSAHAGVRSAILPALRMGLPRRWLADLRRPHACKGVEAEELRIRNRLRKPAAEAIIAALSVQSACGGIFSSMPSRRTASATRSRSSSWPPPRPRSRSAHAGALKRLLELQHQRRRRPPAGTRPRGRRAARACLLGPELAHRVDERGLQTAEAEVERLAAPHPDRELEAPRVAFAREPVDLGAARDSPGPSCAPPCRAPRRRRRRGWLRAARSRRGRSTARAACGRRSRSGTGTAARSGRARGSSPPRGRGGGRPATNGSRAAAASAFAVERPISSAPIRPGPLVAATAPESRELDAGARRAPRRRPR